MSSIFSKHTGILKGPTAFEEFRLDISATIIVTSFSYKQDLPFRNQLQRL